MSDVLYVTTVVTPLAVLFPYVSLEIIILQISLSLLLSRRAYQGPNKFNALFEGGSKKKREPYPEILSGTSHSIEDDLGTSESRSISSNPDI
jgi:hypothetical protein